MTTQTSIVSEDVTPAGRHSRHTRAPRRILFVTSQGDTTVLSSLTSTSPPVLTTSIVSSLVPAPSQAPAPKCVYPKSPGLAATGILSTIFGIIIALASGYFLFRRYFEIKITRKPSKKSAPEEIALAKIDKTGSTSQQEFTEDKSSEQAAINNAERGESSTTKQYAGKGLDLIAQNRDTIQDKILANRAADAAAAAGNPLPASSGIDPFEDPMGHFGQNGVKYGGMAIGKAIEHRETIQEKIVGALIAKFKGKKKAKETSEEKQAISDKPSDQKSTGESTDGKGDHMPTADPQVPAKGVDKRVSVYYQRPTTP